ncbi:MAG: alkylhydroperoxidase family enzyme, partial [Alphaproteobacteria bacterium]
NELTDGDFDKLRDMGISDAEIVEIVALSGMGVYLNIVADALKIEVDDMIKQGLAA